MKRLVLPVLLAFSASACLNLNLINYVGKGYEAYQKGDLEAAEQFFRTAVKKRPRDAIAHNDLGLVLMELDRTEEAIPFLKLSTILDKTRGYAAPHINLARAYYEQGKLDLALAAGEKALGMNSSNPVILLTLANIYCARNEKISDARNFAKTATEKISEADRAAAWSTLAEAEYKMKNIEAAVSAIDTALSFDTDNSFYKQQKALYRP